MRIRKSVISSNEIVIFEDDNNGILNQVISMINKNRNNIDDTRHSTLDTRYSTLMALNFLEETGNLILGLQW